MASNLSSRPPLSSPGGINQNLIQKFKNFNIEPVQYPSDLGGEDLKHWVQFTINVRGKSLAADTLSGGGRLGNETDLGAVTRDPNSANFTNEEISNASTAAITATGAVAAGAVSGSNGKSSTSTLAVELVAAGAAASPDPAGA